MAWLICTACGKTRTDEERRSYEHHCAACERAALARREAWRKGAADYALDARYGAPKPSLH